VISFQLLYSVIPFSLRGEYVCLEGSI